MNIQQFNTRFNELVTEEVHHLRDNLTTEQKKKLKVGILTWDDNCVYIQTTGYFSRYEALELKRPFIEEANTELNLRIDPTGMGVMEVYLYFSENFLPKKQWQAAKSRLVNIIKGKTTEPLIPFYATLEQIKTEFELKL